MKGKQGKRAVVLASFVGFCCLVLTGNAIVFVSTGDPSYNTNAPTGSLTNSGWQYEGQWYVWLGTPIAPTYFLTAHHVNGNIGDPFVLNGFPYKTVANYDDPESDLRIWKVAQTFPYYAPLYTNTDEVGKTLIVFGRGTDRGGAVLVNTTTNGWLWGNNNNIERWGENIVSDIYTNIYNGNTNYLLQAAFDRNGITNECDLTLNDSGGGLFIQNGSTWKLAGINYTVDGPFSHDGTTSTEFNGALVDLHGLWIATNQAGTAYELIPTNGTPAIPTSFYCTRVSTRISWINSIINYDLGNDLGIAAIETVGSDTQISLITSSNRFYRVDTTTNLVNSVWTTVTNNIPGNGGTVTVVDPGAATLPARYYRAAVLP